MRQYSADVLDKLEAGKLEIRQMIRFEFGTGTYGFWTGSRAWTFEGVEYLPGGILEISPIDGSVGLAAEGFTVRLGVSDEDGITPDILATIEQEDYHQRIVRLFDLYIDPETQTLAMVEPVRRGRVDTIDHTGGDDPGLTINCESRNLDNSREGYRSRSHADQQLISPGDLGLKNAEAAGTEEIFWGRKKP